MKVLALDYDGTIASDDGELCEQARQKLPLYKKSYDVQIVPCTGRRLSSIEPCVRDFADAIVAENGGVIDWGDRIEIGEPVTQNVEQLCRFHFPDSQCDIRRTTVFIDCHPDNFPSEFTDKVISKGYELVRNNSTACIGPPEYTKAHGLRHAMAYRRDNHTVVAAGDSENDIDLLKMADYALVPGNGDEVLTESRVGPSFHRGSGDYFEGIEDRLHKIISGV